MPFLIPLIPALIAGAGAVGGIVEGAQAGGRQQKALTEQEQIAQQEQANKQQAFKQLTDFFTPYLKEGSPFLKLIQQASAATTATGANNAAGAIRNTVGASGLGFGPSGTTGEAIASEGASTNATSSSNYLSNLLNNEAVKFQAAQGINAAGTMAGSPQNQPNVSVQLPFQSTGSGLTGLAQILKGLINPKVPTTTSPGGGTPVTPGGPNLPSLPSNPPGWGIGLPNTGSTPTTEGWAT
jgi:hypothetical protein